jgi:class 3 adenylate cyclase
VAIGTFGLAGSVRVNFVANNALPCCRHIYQAARDLGIKVKMGLTLGRVYCGVVGSSTRHEFAVLGPSVNLAARLMCSPKNRGLLCDQKVVDSAPEQAMKPLTVPCYPTKSADSASHTKPTSPSDSINPANPDC